MQLLRRAADKNSAMAQNGLGEIYSHGDGVPRDYVQAAHWFRLAADNGNSFGALNLGLIYAEGRGVPRDRNEADKWFQKSAAAGNETAIARLAREDAATAAQ
jgi:hypothetical protein